MGEAAMMTDKALLEGELVHLVAEDVKTIAETFSRWYRDSEYWRLMASNPAMPHSPQSIKKWLEKLEQNNPPAESFWFLVRTLEDDKLIGEVELDGVQWAHGDTFVGISLGEREYWGRGYGTDAMRVMLRYAFMELNLFRVSLNVYGYNRRAIRSYEKVGFKYEGQARKVIHRDGKRFDLMFMGILREEWEARYCSDGKGNTT
jgi:RimJ/RimL family protein N-acetyltransferase